MKTLACITVAIAALAGPAVAQVSLADRPTIVVIGNGEAEAQPDQFEVEVVVLGRGATQVEALQAFSTLQSGILETLPRLQGLTQAHVTTGATSVAPRYGPTCETDQYNRDTRDCPVIGYFASSILSFTGSPAERAGDAVSMASELGASQARLGDYALIDSRALQDAANRAAFSDAERQAKMLAEASGRRIVRILRIQDPSARVTDISSESEDVNDIIVTARSFQSPTVSIAVAPEPVQATARVTVVFEIE